MTYYAKIRRSRESRTSLHLWGNFEALPTSCRSIFGRQGHTTCMHIRPSSTITDLYAMIRVCPTSSSFSFLLSCVLVWPVSTLRTECWWFGVVSQFFDKSFGSRPKVHLEDMNHQQLHCTYHNIECDTFNKSRGCMYQVQ